MGFFDDISDIVGELKDIRDEVVGEFTDVRREVTSSVDDIKTGAKEKIGDVKQKASQSIGLDGMRRTKRPSSPPHGAKKIPISSPDE